jgi:hypothetical protein
LYRADGTWTMLPVEENVGGIGTILQPAARCESGPMSESGHSSPIDALPTLSGCPLRSESD